MVLTFRPIKVWPDGWRGHTRGDSPWSPFKADWRDTMTRLGRELSHLGTDEATLQLDVNENACRIDGGLKERSVVGYHGVILSFDTRQFGTLTYPCNKFDAPRDPWRHNLRAIVLGLESLRRVERYGIADRGQQYAGYAELGTGIALGQGMTVELAAKVLAGALDGWDAGDLLTGLGVPDVPSVREAYKRAALIYHPDNGGDPEDFHKITEARDVLLR